MSERGIVESTARAWVRRGRTAFRRAQFRFATRPDGNVRLHLGCGRDYWTGYVNVDADPAATSDLCISFTEIGAVFRDASVSEAVMIHSLSYLTLWEARDLFRTIARLMQPGGQLVIELPDLAKCARSVINHEGNLDAYLEALRGVYAFDMEWMASRRVFTPYVFGWSSWHLKLELEQAGFGTVLVCDPQTHEGRLWRDTRIEATK